MSSFGSQTRKRLKELYRAGKNVPKIIDEVATAATIEAVETATQNTPPNAGGIGGTNTRDPSLAPSWAIDSTTDAVNGKTVLANNMEYASYVNDGHRVDRHFVPGLVVNGNLLEQAPNGEGGLTVGTKTQFVKGLYIKEKAIGKYRSTVTKMLKRKVEEAFKKQ